VLEISDSCYICLPYLEEDEQFISGLQEVFSEVIIHEGKGRPSKEELKDIVKEYESIIIGTQEELDEEIAESAKKLKSVGTLSTGLDHIDLPAFEENGIEIFNTGQTNSISVAEHTIGLILSLQKRLIESHKSVLEGKDREGLRERPTELSQKTVGVIGAGSIARELVNILQAFNTKIKVWTFHPEKHRDMENSNVELESDLKQLIKTSDIVSIHVPLSEKTEDLINQKLVRKISTDKSRILINTSRSGIVDKSMLEGLGESSVFNSAGIDVYPEDLPNNSNDRMIFTPHIAGLTQESSRRMRDELVSKLSSKHI
jgi:D-3-phosphoglycerate dehydrogenase